MAAKKRKSVSRKDRPAEWPKPRPRVHVPKEGVRKGPGRPVFAPNGGGGAIAGSHPGNTGGKKGRSGRKPRLFKEFCKRVIESPAVQDRVVGVLMRSHKASEVASMFLGLASYVVEKPKTTVEHRGLTLEELVAGSNEDEDATTEES